MKFITDLFKKEIKLTEKEIEVKEIINLMCSQKDIKIVVEPIYDEYYISDEINHYDIIIESNQIIITNSTHSTYINYRMEFIKMMKDIVKNKTIESRKKIKDNITERESKMLSIMKKTLKENLK